jgi:hypothetical protein
MGKQLFDPVAIDGLLARLQGAAFQFHDRPIRVGEFMFVNPVDRDMTLFHLRDSIGYRARCLRYHCQILENLIHAYHENAKVDAYQAYKDAGHSMLFFKDEVMFVYDDVVFHCVSFFDYLASFLSYPFYKDKEPTAEFKWNTLYNRCHPTMNTPVRQTLFAPLVRSNHTQFIDKLQRYRGDLYHNKKDFAPSAVSYDMMKDFTKYEFHIPKSFYEVFKEHFENLDGKDLTILDAADWIYATAMQAGSVLIDAFGQEIVKQFPPHLPPTDAPQAPG